MASFRRKSCTGSAWPSCCSHSEVGDESKGKAFKERKAGKEEGTSELVEMLRVRLCPSGRSLTGGMPKLQTKVRVHGCDLLYAGMWRTRLSRSPIAQTQTIRPINVGLNVLLFQTADKRPPTTVAYSLRSAVGDLSSRDPNLKTLILGLGNPILTDDGIGIAPVDFERIFMRFEQINRQAQCLPLALFRPPSRRPRRTPFHAA